MIAEIENNNNKTNDILEIESCHWTRIKDLTNYHRRKWGIVERRQQLAMPPPLENWRGLTL